MPIEESWEAAYRFCREAHEWQRRFRILVEGLIAAVACAVLTFAVLHVTGWLRIIWGKP